MDPTSTRGRGRRRRWSWIAGLALLLPLGLDLARPPSRQVTNGVLLGAVDLYQGTVSPVLSRAGVRCRFRPSCSHYAEGALRRFGALGGSLRIAWRLVRCGPWTPMGTVDPP